MAQPWISSRRACLLGLASAIALACFSGCVRIGTAGAVTHRPPARIVRGQAATITIEISATKAMLEDRPAIGSVQISYECEGVVHTT